MNLAICPRCRADDEVRTVQELFEMLNGMRAGALQGGFQGPPMAPPPARRRTIDDDYDRDDGMDQAIANAVLGAVTGFAARKIGKRMRRAFEERVAPALDARMQQAQQQWDDSLSDQDAIVERYPDLHGCLRDQVLFLAGGTRVVPISDIRFPVTLEQADALAARLR